MFKYIFDVYSLYLVYARVRGGGEKLEVRRLIKFGNSSYVVSLPKTWIKKNNLDKGALLYLNENGNGELIFSPNKLERKREFKNITINTNDKDFDQIKRELLSAYINDYNEIQITSDSFRDSGGEIKHIIYNLVGLEITEQNNTKIIAKDLLNLDEVSIKDITRRIDLIIRSMFDDLKSDLNDCTSEDINYKDGDINRLSFLVFRVVKKAIEDPNLLEKFDMSHTDLMKSWRVANSLEQIGDNLKRICRFYRKIKFKKGESEKFKKLLIDIEGSYKKIMDSYHKNDMDMSYKVASMKKMLMKDCDKFMEKYTDINLIRIVEKLKNIQGSVGDISRVIYMGYL